MSRGGFPDAPGLPRAFAWAQFVFFAAAALLLFAAPRSWDVLSWVLPAMFVFNGLQWALWPQSSPAFHPFGVRAFGIVLLVVAGFLFIQFIPE